MALIAPFAPMARSTNWSTHSMVITGYQLQNVTVGSAACLPLAGQFLFGLAPVSATLQVVDLRATIYAVPTLVIIMS